MVIRKKPDADLRNYHSIFLEVGLLLVLIIFIVLTRIDIRASSEREFVPMEREVVQMEEIIQTRQIETPPPPPRPPVPVAVPNDVIIDDINIQIYTWNATWTPGTGSVYAADFFPPPKLSESVRPD